VDSLWQYSIEEIEMKKLLLLLFSILFSFNSYGEEVELDFSLDTFCDQSPRAQLRNGLFYLPNQQKPYSGENLCVYLSNGQYFSKGEIKKGLREGDWNYWKENGQREKVEYYKDGTISGGIAIHYYSDDSIMRETGYIGDEIDEWGIPQTYHGKDTFWFANGQKRNEYYFNNNIPDGKWTNWFENGQQSGEGNFKDGTGTNIVYFENGQISYSANFKDGVGFYSGFHKNGQIKYKNHFKDGKRHGKNYSWNWEGQLYYETTYEYGELVSEIDYEAEKLAEEKTKEAQKLAQEAAEKMKIAKAKEAEEKAREAPEKKKIAEAKAKDAETKRITEEAKAKDAEKLAKEAAEKKKIAEAKAKEAEEKAILQSAWISNIAAEVRSNWRFSGENPDWFVKVLVTQNKEGEVLNVEFGENNVGNSDIAKAFKNSVERAVYKAIPLPIAPDVSVWDKDIMFIFSAD
jgi:antitoxin component YwqK of YwqJK toxin-antitoxin module